MREWGCSFLFAVLAVIVIMWWVLMGYIVEILPKNIAILLVVCAFPLSLIWVRWAYGKTRR